MSLSLLLEKYDVSTKEGLEKALKEIEKEEAEVDEALTGVLSRSCTIEGRLRTASQAYTKLGEVKTDAQTAADMVDKTATLARDVSAKVRQLDLARSRVAECQRRVHDLIDLQLCSAGVEAAIKAHDYETGAAHVSRFLSMDPGSVAAARARGAADPRHQMATAANTLRDHLVRKFEEAARKEDEASVERLFKLFPQIGRAEEGVDLLAKYIATQAEVKIGRACAISDAHSEVAVFADALTRVVEAGGAAAERARLAAHAHAPGLLHRSLRHIQPLVCSGARRVFKEMVALRRLEAEPLHPRSGRSPLAVEPVLAELALAHSRVALYFGFLRRKAEVDASTLPEASKKASIDAVEKIINDCDLLRTGQDILAHYLALERYFLEESVNKALKLSQPQPGVTSSSLVDDVFFIARKVIRRSISCGSVDGVCAVLNEVCSVLERNVVPALRKGLRCPPLEPLFLPAPNHHLSAAEAKPDRDLDAHRQLFLAQLNEAEAGAEWAARLAAAACAEAAPLCARPSALTKVTSCAAGLGAAQAAFLSAHEMALAAVAASLKPRAAQWADAIVDPGACADELDDDADALPLALEQFCEAARAQISPRSVDAILATLLADILARAENRILHHHYDRAGGLGVERRARRLALWAGGACAALRERCAALTQRGALLALEAVTHAHDALAPTPRLTPAAAKDTLARRTDFKIEEIKRLKL